MGNSRSTSTEYLLRKFLNATPNADRPMYRKDIYYTGSVQLPPEYHNDIGKFYGYIEIVNNWLQHSQPYVHVAKNPPFQPMPTYSIFLFKDRF